MQALRSHDEIRDVNTRYHDVAAAGYDTKWGIDFGQTGQSQVLGKFRKLLRSGGQAGFPRALEIGAGTGYFSLNLMQAGMIDELTCTDISDGMLEALQANAARLGLAERVYAIRADAESLPFPDGSFDLVVGHAVLHHLPDLERAFSELLRVLEPGGRIVFAGEPSRIGDRLARVPKRAALLAAPAWRRLVGAAPAPETVAEAGSAEQLDHELEGKVDIHAFAPADLTSIATHAGFADVSVRGEELVANWFGWFNRTLEMSAEQADIPMLWRKYAFHGYLLLQKLDQLVLEPRLPAALFYNLLLTARKPLP
jgi:ubiquinone/menaquinone biosynthesis C-methylase UbiE